MKSTLKINKQIQILENDITYFFIAHSDLKNKDIREQISCLSKLCEHVGFLFDSYRDYALSKSNFSKS